MELEILYLNLILKVKMLNMDHLDIVLLWFNHKFAVFLEQIN